LIKYRFLSKPRQKWLAKYFNGVSLIASAGVVSETFVKLGTVWRTWLIVALFVSFVLGLFFAKAENAGITEEG
jgi:hypothetical protein